MSFALTKVAAFGIEAEEGLNKRYKQYLRLTITGANTDVDLDIGDYTSGTFWTAIGTSSTVAATLLSVLKDIQTRASTFTGIGGTAIAGKQQLDGTRTSVVVLNSDASAGGSATETMVVTGLLTTDTIVAVTEYVAGDGTYDAIQAYGNASGDAAANDALSVTWDANPGVGAKVKVAVLRTASSTTPEAGTYVLSMDATHTQIPNLLFATGDAPTSYVLELSWALKDNQIPVAAEAAA